MPRTIEQLYDERTQRIDINAVFAYQKMYGTEDNLDYTNVLRGIHDDTLLNQLFFGKKNISNLDKMLRHTVYMMSGKQYVLGPQDETELVIIMRSIFLTYGKNLGYGITKQIERLNNIVINKTAPRLYSSTTQYLRYLEDSNESHKIVLARPINVSNKGVRVLEPVTGIGFGP